MSEVQITVNRPPTLDDPDVVGAWELSPGTIFKDHQNDLFVKGEQGAILVDSDSQEIYCYQQEQVEELDFFKRCKVVQGTAELIISLEN